MNLIHYNILKFRNFSVGILLLILSVIFSGCTIDFSKYGRYQRKGEVAAMFEKGNLPSDYTYYYALTSSHPKALIGIGPGYTLDHHLWTRVEPAELKGLSDNMWSREEYWVPFYGSYMIDPTGKVIGIYYASRYGGPIVVEPGNQVIVHVPWPDWGRGHDR